MRDSLIACPRGVAAAGMARVPAGQLDLADGLSPEEVTTAEVLSEVGYNTAMWGKWHLGDLPEHAPENQGYDYAYYGLFNGAPDYWQASFEDKSGTFPFTDFPGYEVYKERTGIDLSVAAVMVISKLLARPRV